MTDVFIRKHMSSNTVGVQKSENNSQDTLILHLVEM